jgi:hypothetical protein
MFAEQGYGSGVNYRIVNDSIAEFNSQTFAIRGLLPQLADSVIICATYNCQDYSCQQEFSHMSEKSVHYLFLVYLIL